MCNVPGLAAAACAVSVLSTGVAQSQDPRYHFDIANQSLSHALLDFGHTCHRTIVFTEDIVAGHETSLEGDYTLQGALDQLLHGTDLVAERSDSGEIMIRRRAPDSGADARAPAGLPRTAPGGDRRINAPSLSATAAQKRKTANSGEMQEVIVTGLRTSLVSAETIKRESLGIVDAIVTQDIGQFPDASIGEAIARIPGVTVNRGSINNIASAGAPTSTGQVSGITIRGFATQFNEVLWEGRPVASGNGQSFDFSALGAEYVGELDVHKTPDFALSSGAIGATINIKSPLPLDKTGFQAQSFVAGTDYEKDGSVQPAFGALLSDTFADDTIGILFAGDYTSKHITAHHFDIVGWKGVPNPTNPADPTRTLPGYLPCTSFAVTPAGSGCPAGAQGDHNSAVPSWYPQDQAMYLERTDSRRKDGRLALQWRPTDTVLVTLDDNFSSDDELTYRYQYSTWFGCFPRGCTNVTQDANGTITNFFYPGLDGANNGAPTDFNAFISDTYIVTNTQGINVRWDVNDRWSAELDASASTSRLNPNGTFSDIDADVGYGPNTPSGIYGHFGGTAVDANDNTLPYWTAYGPKSNARTGPAVSPNYLGLNPFIIGSHVFMIQTQENSDKVNQVKLDATRHVDETTVHFGAQFVDDTWDSQELDTQTNNEWQLWAGYGPASNNIMYYCGRIGTTCANPPNPANPGPDAIAVTHGVALPPSLFTPVSVANFIPGFKGNGSLPQSLLLFNPYSVLRYLSTQPPNKDFLPTLGYPNYTGGYPTPVLSPGSVQHVERKNYSPFVTAQQNFPIGDMKLNVNLGLRWQRTDATLAGLAAPLKRLQPNPGDKTYYTFDLDTAEHRTAHNTYSYLLPSLDLNLLITPDLKVRADLSRTETAPNNGQLTPNTTYTGRVDALTETVNNPRLLPYLSDDFDLGSEWYYADNSYLSADGFLKHVTQFPVSSITTAMVYAPDGNVIRNSSGANIGTPALFSRSTVANGLAANVTGVELAWQQMLGWGFGLLVNGTYVHSDRNFDDYSTVANQFALPSIGSSANLIAFYERDGLQARLAVQWQAKQLLQLGQEQNGGAFNEPTYLEANTELDFGASYAIDKHLSVFFEAFNLADSVYHTAGRFDNQTLNLVDYGRSFTFGVRARL